MIGFLDSVGGGGFYFWSSLSEFTMSLIYIVLDCILPKAMREQPRNQVIKRGNMKLIEGTSHYYLKVVFPEPAAVGYLPKRQNRHFVCLSWAILMVIQVFKLLVHIEKGGLYSTF